MYSLRSALIGQPIISLQTGQIVAWVNEPILEIETFEIVALTCLIPHSKHPLLLIARDIRQYAADCIIVDDEDQLTDPDDIARLTSSLKTHYSPMGSTVNTDSGQKLGVVEDYDINLETNRLQNIHVRRSILRALLGSNLIIDRTQIIDVTPERITVRDMTIKSPVITPESIPQG